MSVFVILRQRPRSLRHLSPRVQKTRSLLKHFLVGGKFRSCRPVGLTIPLVGPGVLTRALLQLPRERIRKIIVLENAECFLDSLRVCRNIPLSVAARSIPSATPNGRPSRAGPPVGWICVEYLSQFGSRGSSVGCGSFELARTYVPCSLKHVNSNDIYTADPPLHFIAQLPTSIYGEQLIAQLLRLVPDRGWLFRYGRVPMSYVMHDFVWEVCQHHCAASTSLTSSRSVYRQIPAIPTS